MARKAPADFGWSERLGLRRPRYDASASHASPNFIYPLINVLPIGLDLPLLCWLLVSTVSPMVLLDLFAQQQTRFFFSTASIDGSEVDPLRTYQTRKLWRKGVKMPQMRSPNKESSLRLCVWNCSISDWHRCNSWHECNHRHKYNNNNINNRPSLKLCMRKCSISNGPSSNYK